MSFSLTWEQWKSWELACAPLPSQHPASQPCHSVDGAKQGCRALWGCGSATTACKASSWHPSPLELRGALKLSLQALPGRGCSGYAQTPPWTALAMTQLSQESPGKCRNCRTGAARASTQRQNPEKPSAATPLSPSSVQGLVAQLFPNTGLKAQSLIAFTHLGNIFYKGTTLIFRLSAVESIAQSEQWWQNLFQRKEKKKKEQLQTLWKT